MSAPPLVVDVMIPAYGDTPLLREAIASVLAQTDPHWTLSVVDDGPADPDLAHWCAGLQDSRVSYLHNPRNLGINRNFQRCVELSTHDLVVLVGADDRMLPGYVAAVVGAADDFGRAAMVQPGVRVIDGQGRPVRPLGDRVKSLLAMRVQGRRLVGGEELAGSLLRGNWMYFPAVAFRREWIQRYGFREGYDVVQDLDLYLRMLLDGASLVLVEDVCFEYRRHAASLSSTEAETGGRFNEELAFFQEARVLCARNGWRKAARAADAHLTSRLHSVVRSATAVRAGDRSTARKLAASALDIRGRSLRRSGQ
jgi:glycosyltransferase involved in cell wall biosynthesis